jgi:hypothetical protein
MDQDGNNQVRLTTSPAYDDQPKRSPDGTRIVFMSDRDGNFEIYTMNADGSNQTRLTNSLAGDGFPAWSPDGSKIAFVSGDLRNPTTFEIYVMNANGTNVTRLTNDSSIDGVPAWSPDGTKIVFMSGAANLFDVNSYEIFVMDANGSNRVRLTNNSIVDGQPSFSPDGTKILFASGDAMNPSGIEIFTMNANGSNRTQITTNSVTDGFPVWSRDGSKIFFASGSISNETTVELFVMDANGNNRTQLTTNSSLEWFPDPQPSGPVITTTVQFSATNYVVGEGEASVVVTVARTGDTTGASSVDFATSDGAATQAQDYVVTSGTLNFAGGDTSKSFNVLIVDDGVVESAENFNVMLSNPVGATLGATSSATVSINDNDAGRATTPAAKRFAAALDGAQETPANTSTAKGTGLVLLNGPETSAQVGLIFQNLGSPETVAHVHGPSAPGVAAPIIFPLPSTNPVINFVISPTAQQVGDLRANLHYLNVHSNNFPNGEIRGQLRWNPTLEENFFVRQQYLDFLSRDGDPGGFAFWLNQVGSCVADAQCFHDRTISTSDAFFFEPEFQQTAGYVFRAYRAAFGNNQPFPNPDGSNPTEANKLVNYGNFVADRARVVGGANLAQAQLDFANLFVTRSAFTTKYAGATTAATFVDAILATIQAADAVDLSGQRQTLIDQYNNAGGGNAGRAMVLYRLADDNAQSPINNLAFINAEYNRQFALTLYFGYLRRNPDIGGLLFWQGQINLAPARDVPKQNALVCSFITAAEYQFRFGTNAPRNNAECPQ